MPGRRVHGITRAINGLSKRADRCHSVEATRQLHADGKTRFRGGGGTERGRN